MRGSGEVKRLVGVQAVEAIAWAWFEGVQAVGPAPLAQEVVAAHLIPLVERLVGLLASRDVDREGARAVGRALGEMNQEVGMFVRSQEVCTVEFGRVLGDSFAPLQVRWASVWAEVAVGFFGRREQQVKVAIARWWNDTGHDLRTTLASMGPFAIYLLEGIGGPLTEEQQRMLTQIVGASELMLATINDLINLAKIETDTLELNHETFEIASLVPDLEQMAKYIMGKREAAFELLLGDSLGVMHSDMQKVSQVMGLLLEYICRLMPTIERVVLSITRETQRVDDAVIFTLLGIGTEIPTRAREDWLARRLRNDFYEWPLEFALAHGLCRLLGGRLTFGQVGDGWRWEVRLPGRVGCA